MVLSQNLNPPQLAIRVHSAQDQYFVSQQHEKQQRNDDAKEKPKEKGKNSNGFLDILLEPRILLSYIYVAY